MKNFFLNNWISLTSLTVALLGFWFNWWTNHINITASFKWIRSKNDNSVKLIIKIVNLSPRTTMITNLVLKSNKKVISDNNYDYDTVEKRISDEKDQQRIKKHQDKINEIENMKEPDDYGNLSSVKKLIPSAKKTMLDRENARFNKENMSMLTKQIRVKPKTIFKSDSESESKNFVEMTNLPGNGKLEYSYWLDEVPSNMEVTFSRLIMPFHSKKSFKVPSLPKNIDQD